MTSAPAFRAAIPGEGAKVIDEAGNLDAEFLASLKFDGQGLLCAVVQDFSSGRVLMVGWMNAEALRRTLTQGRVTFWSRSRQEFWRKGDTSGHCQFVRSVEIDCDRDALLLQVEQVGGACHTGKDSCFDEGGALACKVGEPAK